MYHKKTLVDALVFVAIIATVIFYTFLESPTAAFVSFLIGMTITWFRRDIYMVLSNYGNSN